MKELEAMKQLRDPPAFVDAPTLRWVDGLFENAINHARGQIVLIGEEPETAGVRGYWRATITVYQQMRRDVRRAATAVEKR